MAAAGCPGRCGYFGSLKAVTAHMNGCTSYAELYASGAELLDPVAIGKAAAVHRAPAPVSRAPRVPVTELSDQPARVSPTPRKRDPVPAPEAPAREPGPVFVEHWTAPQSL